MKFSVLAVLLAAALELVAGAKFPDSAPSTRDTCACNGTVVERTIRFEVDADGKPLKAGDTPNRLQFGVVVTGTRRSKGKVPPSNGNDLVIFDTENPTGMDEDLAIEGEKKVLIIHENNDKSDPDDSQFGGLIEFTFNNPVCLIKELKFLDIEREEIVFVNATTASGSRLPRLRVPHGGQGKLSTIQTPGFVDVTKLHVELGVGKRATGAITALTFTRCIGTCKDGSTLINGACEKCSPGLSSINGQSCRNCPAGTFSNREGSLRCQQCPENSVSQPGSSRCIRCEGNTVPDETKTRCVECNPGTEARRNSQCVNCQAGRFSPDGANCRPCLGNTISGPNAARCNTCPDGTRADNRKQECETITSAPSVAPTDAPSLAPISCNNNAVLPPGGSRCVRCRDNQVPNDSKTACVPCSPGTEARRNIRCARCTAGRFSPDGNICRPCLGNSVALAGSSTCTPCETGFMANTRKNRCEPLSAAPTVAPTSSPTQEPSLAPISCNDNAVLPPGGSRCQRCRGNTVPDETKTRCVECNPGTEARRNSQCVNCQAGRFSPDGANCRPCLGNTISGPNAARCNTCPDGTRADNRKQECETITSAPSVAPTDAPSLAPISCNNNAVLPPGGSRCVRCRDKQVPNDSKTACVPCSPGTEARRNIRCARCPAGRFSPDGNICRPCLGNSVALAGSSTCSPCETGFMANTRKNRCEPLSAAPTVAPTSNPTQEPSLAPISCNDNAVLPPGGSRCQRCRGNTVPDETKTRCVECNPGTEARRNSQCVNCQAGRFSPDGANCRPCLGNTISGPNAARCNTCPDGTRADNRKQECETITSAPSVAPTDAPSLAPISCNNNAVLPPGGSRCVRCRDKQVPNDSKTACVPCSPGTEARRNIRCARCPAGRFSPDGNTCRPCLGNSVALAGSSTCSPCETGFMANTRKNRCEPLSAAPTVAPTSNPTQEPSLAPISCNDNAVLPPGGSRCQRCRGNTVPDETKTRCVECNPGTEARRNSQCVNCQAGRFSPDGANCRPCLGNTISGPNAARCNTCPDGTRANNRKQECETITSAPSVAPTDAPSLAPISCNDNAVLPPGGSRCVRCRDNTVPNPTQTDCIPCGLGTEVSRNRQCVSCRAGTYGPDGFVCELCPGNSISGPSADICTACREGFLANSLKTLCERETSVPTIAPTQSPVSCNDNAILPPGASRCERCTGSTVPDPTKTDCIPCGPGTEEKRNAECVPCREGRFSPDGVKCDLCQGNTISLPNAASCTPCEEGFVANNRKTECERVTGSPTLAPTQSPTSLPTTSPTFEPSMAPVSCNDNAVLPPGASRCERCRDNTVPNSTKTACVPCSPGTQASRNIQCVICPAGRFSPDGGRCQRCLGNTISLPNAASCTPCEERFVANNRKTECQLLTSSPTMSPTEIPTVSPTPIPTAAPVTLDCQENQVAPPGSTRCVRCRGNTVPDPSKTRCIACVPGSAASNKNTVCIRCEAGRFSPDGEKCRRCQGNTISGQKATSCTPCNEGETANEEKTQCIPPTDTPTTAPTLLPTLVPTSVPTLVPTSVPTQDPRGSIPGGGTSAPVSMRMDTPEPTLSPIPRGDTSRPTMPSSPTCPPIEDRSPTSPGSSLSKGGKGDSDRSPGKSGKRGKGGKGGSDRSPGKSGKGGKGGKGGSDRSPGKSGKGGKGGKGGSDRSPGKSGKGGKGGKGDSDRSPGKSSKGGKGDSDRSPGKSGKGGKGGKGDSDRTGGKSGKGGKRMLRSSEPDMDNADGRMSDECVEPEPRGDGDNAPGRSPSKGGKGGSDRSAGKSKGGKGGSDRSSGASKGGKGGSDRSSGKSKGGSDRSNGKSKGGSDRSGGKSKGGKKGGKRGKGGKRF